MPATPRTNAPTLWRGRGARRRSCWRRGAHRRGEGGSAALAPVGMTMQPSISPHPERSRRAHDIDAIAVAPARQKAKRFVVPANQRFLLRACPSLYLTLSGDHVRYAIEFLVEHQANRATCR